MRPMGKFTYLLSIIENGSFLAQVESGVEIHIGDELNWKGNKILVKNKTDNLLEVKKIGSAIIVE